MPVNPITMNRNDEDKKKILISSSKVLAPHTAPSLGKIWKNKKM